MPDIFRVSEAASLALHAMVYLAAFPEERVTTQTIAGALHASEHHLAKVMQRLVHAGLIRSTRGPAGGFQLNKSDREINLLEIYEAVDGPLEPRSCLLGSMPLCGGDRCFLGGLNVSVHQMVKNHFADTRLTSLTRIFGEKNENQTTAHSHR